MECQDERWLDLMESMHQELTEEELEAGWHFCPDFDYLLVGPGMAALECCSCRKENSND